MTTQEFLDALKAIPTKLTSMAIWKKALIIGSICIVVLGVNDFGFYCLGTKTCKPVQPPTIEQVGPSSNVITDKTPAGKSAIDYCGKISGVLSIDKKYKVKVIAKNKCDTYIDYFQVDIHCPVTKNQLGFGLGVLFTYDNIGKKFTPLVGGTLQYSRFWGNIGFGPQLRIYSAIDKSMYSVGLDAVVSYRW